MSVGAVNKSTGDRIPTAGMPAIDDALDLTSVNPVQNAVITAALSGKQNTLTFDDTPTDNSNNPVKSNGIYDALALKQNTTDNSLDTTAKTIVGAINEHEGDIDSLRSGLTNVHDGFKDAIGWDNHKNLFDKNATDTSNGFVPNAGLGSDNSTSATDASNVSEYIPVASGVKYTLQALVGNQAGICFYNSSKEYIRGEVYANQPVKTVTTPSNCAYIRFTINKANIDLTQLEVGDTATTYEPYHPVIGPAVEELQSGVSSLLSSDLLFSGAPTTENTFESKSLVSGKKFSDYQFIVVVGNHYNNSRVSLVEPTHVFRQQTSNQSRIIMTDGSVNTTELYYLTDTTFMLKQSSSDVTSFKTSIYGMLKSN